MKSGSATSGFALSTVVDVRHRADHASRSDSNRDTIAMSPTDSSYDRRTFLKTASAAGAGALIASRAGPLLALDGSPAEKVVVAIMGLNSRGEVHMEYFPSTPNVEVAYLCDVDQRALAKGVAMVAKKQSRKPKAITDVRRALED